MSAPGGQPRGRHAGPSDHRGHDPGRVDLGGVARSRVLAEPQDGHSIGDVEHLRDVVGDQQHPEVAAAQVLDQVVDRARAAARRAQRSARRGARPSSPRSPPGRSPRPAAARPRASVPGAGRRSPEPDSCVNASPVRALMAARSRTPRRPSTPERTSSRPTIDVRDARAMVRQRQVLVDGLDADPARVERGGEVDGPAARHQTSPASGLMTPAATLSSVDLPAAVVAHHGVNLAPPQGRGRRRAAPRRARTTSRCRAARAPFAGLGWPPLLGGTASTDRACWPGRRGCSP